jgi:hypothetical protein
LISFSASQNPPDSVQEILCNIYGLRGFLREDILDFPKPVPCFDQDARESGPVREFDVGAHVADDKGTLEIDLKGIARLLYETCLWFSAIAVTGKFGNRSPRVVRTEKNPVNVPFFLFDPGEQEMVKCLHKIQGVIAPGHSGLVGDHKDKEPVTVKHSYGLRHPRKNSETVHMVDIAHLLVDGPVPIDENRGFFHLSSVSKTVTRSEYKAIRQ